MFVLILILVFPIILLAYSIPQKENQAFIEKLALSFKQGEFDMKDYLIWCASVIKDKNGKYYIERIDFFWGVGRITIFFDVSRQTKKREVLL